MGGRAGEEVANCLFLSPLSHVPTGSNDGATPARDNEWASTLDVPMNEWRRGGNLLARLFGGSGSGVALGEPRSEMDRSQKCACMMSSANGSTLYGKPAESSCLFKGIQTLPCMKCKSCIYTW